MTGIKRILAILCTLVSIISSFFGIDINNLTDKKVDSFKVTTYIRGDYALTPESLNKEDFDIITDVIIFECASFNNKGEIIVEKEKLETVLNNLKAVAGDRDLHITANLWGPGGHTDSDVWEDQMEAQSDEHNKAFTSGVFEDNIVKFLSDYKLDGIHFDYEYPISTKAWLYYNAFLVSLGKKLSDKYTLGVAANEWNLKFSTAAVAAVDTFEMMMYDYNDSEGRHSTYENTVELMKKTGLSGIPLEKVNLGLPFYSRPTDMSGYWYGYNGCYESIDENGWYHCESTGKDFWFNTPDVIYNKTAYAIKNGCGGIMVWHYSCDLPSSHEDSLLRAVGKAVNDNYGS